MQVYALFLRQWLLCICRRWCTTIQGQQRSNASCLVQYFNFHICIVWKLFGNEACICKFIKIKVLVYNPASPFKFFFIPECYLWLRNEGSNVQYSKLHIIWGESITRFTEKGTFLSLIHRILSHYSIQQIYWSGSTQTCTIYTYFRNFNFWTCLIANPTHYSAKFPMLVD